MCRQQHNELQSDTAMFQPNNSTEKTENPPTSTRSAQGIEDESSSSKGSSRDKADTMQKPRNSLPTYANETMDSTGPKEDREKGSPNSKASYESSSDETEPDLSSLTKSRSKKRRSSLTSVKTQAKIPLEDVGPYDVLSGRDKAVFNHVGNRRFRVSLALWIPRYEEAQTKSQKAAVIGSLCHMLQHEAGVRFLKREYGRDGEKDYYIELNATQTKKKVGHAIRDMSVARKEVSQRRLSARKARRKARNKNPGSDIESSGSEDDTSFTSEGPSESDLRVSLSALLPFVSDHQQDEIDASMEPLPFAGKPSDQEDPSVFVPQTATSSTKQNLHASSLHESAPAAFLQPTSPLPPPQTHPLVRSNTFPGPQPLYHANHYHYHYYQHPHQQQQQQQEASFEVRDILLTSQTEQLQQMHQAHQQHRHSLYDPRLLAPHQTKGGSRDDASSFFGGPSNSIFPRQEDSSSR